MVEYDSELRGPGFDPHRRHRVVSLTRHIKSIEYWLNPGSTDMTEKLLTGTLCLNKKKKIVKMNKLKKKSLKII